MAVEIGSATDHEDLFNKLYTFLTSHADLVNAGQQWERVASVGQVPPFSASQGTSGAGDENDTAGWPGRMRCMCRCGCMKTHHWIARCCSFAVITGC